MPHLENAIAAAFDHLDLVVESFHKTAVIPMMKVIGDLVVPVMEGGQEVVETLQTTGANRGAPGVNSGCVEGLNNKIKVIKRRC